MSASKSDGYHTIVSIDFGTTSTKCAVAVFQPGGADPEIDVLKWSHEGKSHAMLPSVVSYDEHHTDEFISYGFNAKDDLDRARRGRVVYGMFKNQFPGRPVQPLHGSKGDKDADGKNADELFVALATKLHIDIKHFYENTLMDAKQAPKWEQASIEYAVSVPAAGAPANVAERLRQVLTKAGFDALPHHGISKQLVTESEAAAIFSLHTEKNAFKNDQTTIVMDAGGGTSDLCVLRVVDKETGEVSLQFADPVAGAQIGPAWVHMYLEQRLVQFLSQSYPQDHAEATARSIVADPRVEERKVDIGSGKAPSGPLEFRVSNRPLETNSKAPGPTLSPVGGLSKVPYSKSRNIDIVRIENRLIQGLFDDEILGVTRDGQKCLKRQLDMMIEDAWISGRGPQGAAEAVSKSGLAPDHLCVDRILLTGGFGSSPYVLKTLQDALFKERDLANKGYTGDGLMTDPSGGLGPVHTNIKNLQFVVSTEPRLCVCKGVLYHHIRTHMEALRKPSSKSWFRYNWNKAKKFGQRVISN
ncbi:hypothetical protein MAPG_01817 [Magnaporthiopsis poae ATCC 64411]|uniref:Hsp70-like protein n=1 Tax=Magnaporthiopsis poae (strain ATCC 64411 / 73-15) TaxID=644358 RepID=A0A0C4DPP6_MAGP6|nr:hypothetical protein MAPG_01817 [Magnaporthiopsis poae ATCC 64411]